MKVMFVVDEAILFFLRWLNKKHLEIQEKYDEVTFENPNKYESLLPNEKSDENQEYSKALSFALEEPNVNNIAVTGPYGSGKSSFLRSFEKKNAQWNYLPVSLATFKDIHKEDDEEITSQDIERSILQQFFYTVKDTDIPFSRFKKIKSFTKTKVALYTVAIAFLFLHYISIYFPNEIIKFFPFDINIIDKYTWLLSSISFVIVATFVYKSIKYLMGLQVSKLNFKKGEIDFGKQDHTSILNNNLDEIIYFFEATSFNVVVFEDLDRFNNAEIFIKLRELNLLINNSKQVNRRIRFIYALKDDMFEDKDRSKFFDFILPIIPYINHSTSYEMLTDKFQEEDIEVSFLRDISLYVEDMRLLINIYNEYIVYKYKIGNKLDKTKLLAMIVYKNYYPKDFSDLHFKKGLYKLFQNKPNYIDAQIVKHDDDIKELITTINQIEDENNTSIQELRTLYLYKIAEKLQSNLLIYSDFDGQLKQWNTATLIDENFELLRKTSKIHSFDRRLSIDFSDIEKEVNKKFTYLERKNFIEEKLTNKLSKLKQKVEYLKNQKNELKLYSLEDILFNFTVDDLEHSQEYKDKELLVYLLRRGHINEDYHLYISYFFEGSVTQAEHEFLLSIKNLKPLQWEHKLKNISELLRKIELRELQLDASLNYDLVSFLLDNKSYYPPETNELMLKLSNEEDLSIKFVFEYIGQSDQEHRRKFIQQLKWDGIWKYIVSGANFSDKRQEELFESLFDALSPDAMYKLNIDNSMKHYFEKQTTINITVYEEPYVSEDFKALMSLIRPKYSKLNLSKINTVLFDNIYEKEFYELNEYMIEQIVARKNSSALDELKIANYTTLQKTGLDSLLSYIEAFPVKYITEVFLAIETNTQESEESIIKLVNNDIVSGELKVEIIKKQTAKINDISSLDVHITILQNIIQLGKLSITWENLLYYYQQVSEDSDLDNLIIDFLNIEEHYLVLQEIKIDNEDLFSKEIIQSFSKALLLENKISDEAYAHLVKSVEYWYPSLEIEELSYPKVDTLLSNGKLQLTQSNIDVLKENFHNSHISLMEKFKEELIKEYNNFELDSDDITEVLKSEVFNNTEKFILIEATPLEKIDNNKPLCDAITELYLTDPQKIEQELFEKLFYMSDRNLELLTIFIPVIEKEQISSYLQGLEKPYSSLAEKSARQLKLAKNDVHLALLKALVEKEYLSSITPERTKIKVNRKRN